MENALHMIVETDKASQKKVEQAYARREKLSEELAEKKQEIDAQNKAQAQRVLEQKREAAQKKLESEKARRTERDEQIRARLDRLYAENHASWENDIFRAVTDTAEQA